VPLGANVSSAWALAQVVWHELHGDKSPKLGVIRLVIHSHAATAKFLDDTVMRDGLADHGEPQTLRTAMLGVSAMGCQRRRMPGSGYFETKTMNE
jgi:hypothetical protein